MPIALLAALLCAPGPATGADLHVRWTSPGSDRPVTFTVEDFQPGSLPGFAATNPDGTEYLVHLDVTLPPPLAGEPPPVVVEAVIRELSADRKGRARLKTLATPRIRTVAGTPAILRQGARVPVPGTIPIDYREYALSLEVLYADGTEPAGSP